MRFRKATASAGAAALLSAVSFVVMTAVAPAAEAGTCWYSQDLRTTYNDVCRVGDRHYIVTHPSSSWVYRYAPVAYSYGTSGFSVCYAYEVGWGTYRLDTGLHYPV